MPQHLGRDFDHHKCCAYCCGSHYGKTAAMSISEGAEWVRVEGNHQKTSDQGFTILPQLLRQMDYHLLSFSSS